MKISNFLRLSLASLALTSAVACSPDAPVTDLDVGVKHQGLVPDFPCGPGQVGWRFTAPSPTSSDGLAAGATPYKPQPPPTMTIKDAHCSVTTGIYYTLKAAEACDGQNSCIFRAQCPANEGMSVRYACSDSDTERIATVPASASGGLLFSFSCPVPSPSLTELAALASAKVACIPAQCGTTARRGPDMACVSDMSRPVVEQGSGYVGTSMEFRLPVGGFERQHVARRLVSGIVDRTLDPAQPFGVQFGPYVDSHWLLFPRGVYTFKGATLRYKPNATMPQGPKGRVVLYLEDQFFKADASGAIISSIAVPSFRCVLHSFELQQVRPGHRRGQRLRRREDRPGEVHGAHRLHQRELPVPPPPDRRGQGGPHRRPAGQRLQAQGQPRGRRLRPRGRDHLRALRHDPGHGVRRQPGRLVLQARPQGARPARVLRAAGDRLLRGRRRPGHQVRRTQPHRAGPDRGHAAPDRGARSHPGRPARRGARRLRLVPGPRQVPVLVHLRHGQLGHQDGRPLVPGASHRGQRPEPRAGRRLLPAGREGAAARRRHRHHRLGALPRHPAFARRAVAGRLQHRDRRVGPAHLRGAQLRGGAQHRGRRSAPRGQHRRHPRLFPGGRRQQGPLRAPELQRAGRRLPLEPHAAAVPHGQGGGDARPPVQRRLVWRVRPAGGWRRQDGAGARQRLRAQLQVQRRRHPRLQPGHRQRTARRGPGRRAVPHARHRLRRQHRPALHRRRRRGAARLLRAHRRGRGGLGGPRPEGGHQLHAGVGEPAHLGQLQLPRVRVEDGHVRRDHGPGRRLGPEDPRHRRAGADRHGGLHRDAGLLGGDDRHLLCRRGVPLPGAGLPLRQDDGRSRPAHGHHHLLRHRRAPGRAAARPPRPPR